MSGYYAISPSRNDQWSGKTLFMLLRRKVAEPNRSSTARRPFLVAASAWLLISATLPVTRAHRHVVGLLHDEVTLGVDIDLHLRQATCRRAEDDVGVVGHVERRLVARAQQVVRLLLVQADRAPRMCADLGVRDVVVLRPGKLSRRTDLTRPEADQHRRREGKLLGRGEPGGHDGLDAADLEVTELPRLLRRGVDEPVAGLPPGACQLLGRERPEILQ